MFREIALVAGREISEKLRNRAFLISTLFTLLFVLGFLFIVPLFSGAGSQEYSLAVTGQDSERMGSVVREQASAADAEVTVETVSDRSAAEEAVREGDADAALLGETVLVDGSLSPQLEALLQSGAQQLRTVEALGEAGVPQGEVGNVLDPAPLAVEDLGGEEAGNEGFLALAATLLLFLFIATYGAWIATGVAEEKSSRVVEVVLSSIRPFPLLVGKILGIGFIGLCQLAVVALATAVAAPISGIELPSAAPGILATVLLWYLLGIAFYGCLYAAAGSLVSRQEDVQQTQGPILIFVFIGYGAAFYVLGNPDTLVSRILSFVPPFSPMLVPVRAGLGEIGTLEFAAAVLVMLAAIAGMLALAARIYAGSVLRFGSRVPLREAWKSKGVGGT